VYAFLFFVAHHGEDEVEVGMRKGIVLHARGALATGIMLASVGAMDITSVGHCHGKLSYAFDAREELRMGDIARFNRAYEAFLERFVSYDVAKKEHIT
jgi:hypothetical protein